MKSLREISKTLLLCAASVNLGISSGLIPLGVIFALLFLVLYFRYDSSNVPPYRKLVAYGLVVPFALWWVASPEMEYGVSPWMVFIPAYYLLSLAFLQKRSLGNGGFDVFVLFNGVAVLLLSCFEAHPASLVVNLAVLLLLLHAYGRPGVKWWKHLLFLLLFANFTALSLAGIHYWKNHGRYDSARAADFYAKRHLMGFDPVVKLGSFESNYVNRYNREIALRVWDSVPPLFMRAAVYEKYVGGIWKLPANRDRVLYPVRYKVDYAVFEKSDSSSADSVARPVWVQSALDNFGFFFVPPGALGVAAKNADSVEYFKSGVYRQGDNRRGDWFYYVPHGNERVVDDVPDSADLQVFPPLQGFLDTVSAEIGLQDSLPDSTVLALRSYFLKNFAYALHLDEREMRNTSDRNADPLRVFWRTKSGYCEYFASLSVLLLRHKGVPARYVTGFMRPEISGDGSYAVFRRYSSHAWVEYYSDGMWKPFDPTPPMFVVKAESPSWFSKKMDAVSARLALWFHLLRDGEWRLLLNSWQDASQVLLSSGWTYVFLAVLLFVFILVRVWRRPRARRERNNYGENVLRLIRGLDDAERTLARIGLSRASGETVGAFAVRCSLAEIHTEKERAKRDAAVAFLQKYEDSRWAQEKEEPR